MSLRSLARFASSVSLFSLLVLAAGCNSADGPGTTNGGGTTNGDTTSGGTTPGGTTPGNAATSTRFFLPTGQPDNTGTPRVEVDAQGSTHTVYPAYAGGGAYYAYCGAGCTDEASTQVVKFTTDGTTDNALIALDAAGHPRVLLAAATGIYFGSCDANCGTIEGWSMTKILDHQGAQDVTGEAFTLDPQGHPRFLLHTTIAYLGIGQKPPQTFLLSCDAGCGDESGWKKSQISGEIWHHSTLRYDAAGVAKLAAVLPVTQGGTTTEEVAYLECAAGCETNDGWKGIGLGLSYQNAGEAVSIKPTASLALDSHGAPRVAFIGADEQGNKQVIYRACDADCTNDHWQGTIVNSLKTIGAGLDLALDAKDKPRLALTLNYNIGLLACDDADCSGAAPTWNLTKVEMSDELAADRLFPYPNCDVAAWFLHTPSLALTAGGAPRIAYQSADVSGGWNNPDPTSSSCVAGTDMTFTRLALLTTAIP